MYVGLNRPLVTAKQCHPYVEDGNTETFEVALEPL